MAEGDSNPPSTTPAPAETSDTAYRQGESAVSSRARDLTTNALDFLSNASNETLGACGVALCATTYFVLGRVGLVLIGAVGGVVLHATWEASNEVGLADTDKNGQSRKRQELGAVVANRVLDWRESNKNKEQDETGADTAVSAKKLLDFSDFRPATGSALTTLTDAVIRDYVKWWYGPILPTEEAFPVACRQTLTSFILSLSTHISRKRPADAFLDFVTNSSSIVIVFLNELSAALMAPQHSGMTPAQAVHQYLRDSPDSNLANVLSIKQQQRKLNLVADDILQNFLEPKAYAFEPSKVFLREILAGLILDMTITSCSKPEWINGWIVYLLEEGEPEIMNVIDAGVEGIESQSQRLTKNETAENTVEKRPTQTHQRRVSRAEEAMDQAMLEAKRLSEMIAEEDTKRGHDTLRSVAENDDALSTATTEGMATPTSSDSDRTGAGNSSVDLTRSPNKSVDAFHRSPQASPSTPTKGHNFTDFNQLLTSDTTATLQPANAYTPPADTTPLTLYNASVTIFDDSDPGDKSTLRAKPTAEYLLQIEPVSSNGWMIPRKYTDFESLHEVLRRISVISGVSGFTEKHGTLPTWKGQSKQYLRQNLENYLQHALQFDRLADSEGMKRFLEKDTGNNGASTNSNKPVFGFPNTAAFENVGKGMLDVLGNAPKGVVGGGKAVLGGVQGVFGAVGVGGQKKSGASAVKAKPIQAASPSRTSTGTARGSQDSFRAPLRVEDSNKPPTLPQRNALTRENSSEAPPLPQRPANRPSSLDDRRAQPTVSQESLHLPPPPSEISDNYSHLETTATSPRAPVRTSEESTIPQTPTNLSEPIPPQEQPTPSSTTAKSRTTTTSITESETQMTIELLFAVINELYTLSSAWLIRRTLLNAAKSFLLRPGNPNLEAIRLLLQDSVIDANTSDEGLAANILKIRENALPTEEELKAWPKEMTPEEKEKLRVKARGLLVNKGMPQALTSVMGAAASGEALGRVFDCLQVEEVARGLIFALLLQGVRAATQ